MHNISKFAFAFAAIMTFTLATAAQAGFEYVPAAGAPAQAQQPGAADATSMTPMPVEPVATQPLQAAPAAIPAAPAGANVLTPPPGAQPVLKTKTFAPPQQQPVIPAVQPAAQPQIQPQPQPVAAPASVPVTPAPAPVKAEATPAPTELTPKTAAQEQSQTDNRRQPVPQIMWNPTPPKKKAEAPKPAAQPAPVKAESEILQKIESSPAETNKAEAPAESMDAMHDKSDKWANQLNKDTGETTINPRTRETVPALPAEFATEPVKEAATKEKAKEETSDEAFEEKAQSASNERRPEGLVIPPSVQDANTAPAAQPAAKPEQKPGKLVINPFPKGQPAIASAADSSAVNSPVSDSGEFGSVVGFGSDMPLAIALQQIAPAGYTFSFGPGVDAGARVSWDGANKPWDQVVADTIAPLNLKARIDGKIVHVTSDGAPGKQASLSERPGKPVPLKGGEDLRRENIVDPGEDTQAQPLSTMESLENAVSENADAPVQAEELQPAPKAEPAQKISATVTQENILAGTAEHSTWAVQQGDSLKETLNAWSKKANVELVWNATHDYTVDANITVTDTFQSAVQMVVGQGVKTEKPVYTLEGNTLTVSDQT